MHATDHFFNILAYFYNTLKVFVVSIFTDTLNWDYKGTIFFLLHIDNNQRFKEVRSLFPSEIKLNIIVSNLKLNCTLINKVLKILLKLCKYNKKE